MQKRRSRVPPKPGDAKDADRVLDRMIVRLQVPKPPQVKVDVAKRDRVRTEKPRP